MKHTESQKHKVNITNGCKLKKAASSHTHTNTELKEQKEKYKLGKHDFKLQLSKIRWTAGTEETAEPAAAVGRKA